MCITSFSHPGYIPLSLIMTTTLFKRMVLKLVTQPVLALHFIQFLNYPPSWCKHCIDNSLVFLQFCSKCRPSPAYAVFSNGCWSIRSCEVIHLRHMWYPTFVDEENETPFIRVWKPLPNGRVLNPWGEVQRGQYLLAVGLGHYKWYKSQTPDYVPMRRLFLKGGRHEVMC